MRFMVASNNGYRLRKTIGKCRLLELRVPRTW